MAGSYKKFYGNDVGVKYFPEQNLIILFPKKDVDPTSFRQVKEKLQTILSIDGTNLNKRDGQVFFTIKVSKDTPKENVEEALRSQFHGGDEILSASDLGEEDDEDEEKEEQQLQQPAQQNMPQQPMMPNEVWSILYKNSVLKESTYRTAEYWNVLSRVSGKSKQALLPDDVVSIRKKYTKKPQGKKRDVVLRALDKAMKYFSRKISKDMGPDASSAYKDRYRSIGDLVPSDYAEDKNTQHVPPPATVKSDSPEEEFYDDKIDFSQFFSSQEEDDEEDAYEGYETTEYK